MTTVVPAMPHQETWLETPRRVSDHDWPEDTRPLVSIICITFNHEKYIKECIDGFLMQETSFPIEVIVHDDASQDGTAEILKRYSADYPSLFRLILQPENILSRNIRPTPIAIAEAKGSFIAFCDGDDYWTDPRKLERQVRHLEAKPEANLCFHRVSLLAMDGKSTSTYPHSDYALKEYYDIAEIMRSNPIPTSSVVARRRAVASTPDWFFHMLMNDWPRWVLACENGNAVAIDRVMAVYRMHNESVWQGASEEARLTAIMDFYCVMGIFAPPKIKAIAHLEKEKLACKLIEYPTLKYKIERLTNHIVLGRILRLWKRLINPSLPL